MQAKQMLLFEKIIINNSTNHTTRNSKQLTENAEYKLTKI